MNDKDHGTETFDVVVTRVFGAPVEEVWRAWSDPEQVMRWWGPTGFTSPLARMDFREGGTSLVCMRSPGGQDLYNTWTYTKIQWPGFVADTAPEALLIMLVGCVAATAAAAFVMGVARAHAALGRVMLGPSGRLDLAAHSRGRGVDVP